MGTIPVSDGGGRHALNGDQLPPRRIPPDDLAAEALEALRQFILPDRFQAARLLARWPRYPDMDGDQIRTVLSRYPSRGGGEFG
jgi:hypothetical protein